MKYEIYNSYYRIWWSRLFEKLLIINVYMLTDKLKINQSLSFRIANPMSFNSFSYLNIICLWLLKL